MYKQDLALNELQCLICHKPNQTKSYIFSKEDLSLNSLQWLICHKTPTKPNPIDLIYMYQ